MTPSPQTEPSVSLRVSPDRMSVHATWSDVSLAVDTLLERIYAEALKARLKLPEDRAPGRALLEGALAAGAGPWEVLLLAGTPPVPAVDEVVVWERDFFARGFKMDPVTGRIDYRERAANRSVAPEQVLARIIPGRPGVPGTDVLGKAIPTFPVKKAGIRAGRNITFGADTQEFTATRAGRLRLVDNTLTADETYEVDGSVGLETGNIRFAGHLLVRGEIENLAVVEAEGGIEVSDVVGAAKVQSGGDLVIGWGIAGGGRARIEVQGAVQAGYISGAQVRAGADVTVLKEIVQSNVCCRGAVRVDAGRIVGGQVVALGGIVVGQAGSAAGIPTVLRVGEDYTVSEFLAGVQEERDRLERECEGLLSKHGSVLDCPGRLTRVLQRRFAEPLSKLRAARKRIDEIDKETTERVSKAEAASCKEIRVLKELHPRVTFHIDSQSLTIERPRTGPLLIKRDDARLIAVFSE